MKPSHKKYFSRLMHKYGWNAMGYDFDKAGPAIRLYKPEEDEWGLENSEKYFESEKDFLKHLKRMK